MASGISAGVIKRRLRAGRLDALHHGVYGLPNTADLPLASETAALLSCGEDATLSHHSAATLWGLRPGIALPEPQLQVLVLGYRLDFFWPELRLAVEIDAYGTHGSPARFEADRRRDARLLTEKGISTLRLTRAMIEQRPLEAIGPLARTVGQREA